MNMKSGVKNLLSIFRHCFIIAAPMLNPTKLIDWNLKIDLEIIIKASNSP